MGLLGVAKRLFYSKRKIKALLGGRIDCFFPVHSLHHLLV